MAISKSKLDQFLELGNAVFEAISAYDVPSGKPGVACARGTMTARLNALRIVSGALEVREPTAKDTLEFNGAVSTLNWLKSDAYVNKEFEGIHIAIPTIQFATDHPTIGIVGDSDYRSAITLLARVISEVVLT